MSRALRGRIVIASLLAGLAAGCGGSTPSQPSQPGAPRGIFSINVSQVSVTTELQPPDIVYHVLFTVGATAGNGTLTSYKLSFTNGTRNGSSTHPFTNPRHMAPGDAVDITLNISDGNTTDIFNQLSGIDIFHNRAMRAAEECDLLLAVGTSLQVYPVAGAVSLAKSSGARFVIVNAEPTPFDEIADAVFDRPIGEVLPALCCESATGDMGVGLPAAGGTRAES